MVPLGHNILWLWTSQNPTFKYSQSGKAASTSKMWGWNPFLTRAGWKIRISFCEKFEFLFCSGTKLRERERECMRQLRIVWWLGYSSGMWETDLCRAGSWPSTSLVSALTTRVLTILRCGRVFLPHFEQKFHPEPDRLFIETHMFPCRVSVLAKNSKGAHSVTCTQGTRYYKHSHYGKD